MATVLVTWADADGSGDPVHTFQYAYNATGNTSQVTYAAGTPDQAAVAFEYDAAGNVVAQSDELGRRTDFAYDGANRLIRQTQPDPDGDGPLASPVTTYEYDVAGNLVRQVDPLGRATQYTYQSGQLAGVIRPAAQSGGPATVTGLSYNAAGQLAGVVDPLGRTSTAGFNAIGSRTSVSLADPDGDGPLAAPTLGYAYDAQGRLTESTDALGRATYYVYEDFGRRVTVTEPDPDGDGPLASPQTVYEYDSAGNLVAETDPAGRTIGYVYDDLNRLIRQLGPDPDGDGPQEAPVTSFGYDKAGNLVFQTDSQGRTTRFAYDARNRLTQSTLPDPDGDGPQDSPVVRYAYDAAGELIAETDPTGQTVRSEYDNLGRRIRVIGPDPDGDGPQQSAVTRYAYDAAGRLTAASDALGQTTGYTYDDLDHCTRITDALGGLTAMTYDAVGNMLSLTDPDGNTTSYAYDGLNRVTRETDALGDSRLFAYDALGDLVQRTDRDGRVTVYQYDAAQRLSAELWYPDAADARANQDLQGTIRYTYDSGGRLLTESDDGSTYTYAYNSSDQPTSAVAQIAGLPEVALTSAYDAAGNRTSLSATIGGVADFQTSYQYDVLGQMTRITQASQPGGNAVAAVDVALGYDAAGRLTSLDRFLSGQSVAGTRYQFDAAGQLTGLVHAQGTTTLASYGWTYDLAGRITDAVTPDGSVQYTYDATSQLTAADYTGTSQPADESYAYDANGNRTNSGYATGAANRLLSDGTYTYQYDAEGNRIRRTSLSDGSVTEYAWDHRNRLTRVADRTGSDGPATQVVTNQYDAENRWIGRSLDPDGDGPQEAISTHFVYDGQQIVLQFGAGLSQVSGTRNGPVFSTATLTHRYLWGPTVDQILADEQVDSATASGQVLWPLTDQLGTVRDLAVHDSSTGVTTIADHRVYDSFGKLESQTNAAIDHLFGFTGRPVDRAANLQNNYNRWYDANVQRWLSEDPVEFLSGEAEVYRYAGNSSLAHADPSGLEPPHHWPSIGGSTITITFFPRNARGSDLPTDTIDGCRPTNDNAKNFNDVLLLLKGRLAAENKEKIALLQLDAHGGGALVAGDLVFDLDDPEWFAKPLTRDRTAEKIQRFKQLTDLVMNGGTIDFVQCHGDPETGVAKDPEKLEKLRKWLEEQTGNRIHIVLHAGNVEWYRPLSGILRGFPKDITPGGKPKSLPPVSPSEIPTPSEGSGRPGRPTFPLYPGA